MQKILAFKKHCKIFFVCVEKFGDCVENFVSVSTIKKTSTKKLWVCWKKCEDVEKNVRVLKKSWVCWRVPMCVGHVRFFGHCVYCVSVLILLECVYIIGLAFRHYEYSHMLARMTALLTETLMAFLVANIHIRAYMNICAQKR